MPANSKSLKSNNFGNDIRITNLPAGFPVQISGVDFKLGAHTMIALTEKQYEAIGGVAVQSGTLEREVDEYIARLGLSKYRCRGSTLGPKVTFLQSHLSSHPTAKLASVDFEFTFKTITELIDKRNAVVHRVWSSASNAPISIGDLTATGRKLAIHAREISAVASQLRLARKLLLRLCHEHCPAAAGAKKRPGRTGNDLKNQLIRAIKSP